MRIGFIGCVEFSHQALELIYRLSERADISIAGVVTKRESPFNADFRDLAPMAETAGTPVLYYSGDGKAVESFFTEHQVDVVYCFGWSHLLPRSLLDLPKLGVVGFHPAALPRNRGRHPIIWALALGLCETASTFFRMDEGADSGPIISQKLIDIQDDDDASTLYRKIAKTALAQIEGFSLDMAQGVFTPLPQDQTLANTWRKRGIRDGEIDWRMSARSIHNLIRALARPYVGAHFRSTDETLVKVWKSRIETRDTPANIEPGKILQTVGRELLIKCGDDSSIWLLEHDLPNIPRFGDYL